MLPIARGKERAIESEEAIEAVKHFALFFLPFLSLTPADRHPRRLKLQQEDGMGSLKNVMQARRGKKSMSCMFLSASISNGCGLSKKNSFLCKALGKINIDPQVSSTSLPATSPQPVRQLVKTVTTTTIASKTAAAADKKIEQRPWIVAHNCLVCCI